MAQSTPLCSQTAKPPALPKELINQQQRSNTARGPFSQSLPTRSGTEVILGASKEDDGGTTSRNLH